MARTWTRGRWGLTMMVVALGAAALGARNAPSALAMFQHSHATGANPLRTGVDSAVCNGEAITFSTAAKRIGFVRDCMRRYRIIKAIAPEAARLASLHMEIPEYHDEQRLAATTDAFGPMVMIFAPPTLDGFDYPGQYQEHGARGILSAVVYVDTTVKTAVLPPAYSRLGLRPGMNCLWVSLADGANGWDARMTRVLKDEETCDQSVDPIDLAVVRTLPQRARAGSIAPLVARFTLDRDRQHLIGVACIRGWCDIGPQRADGSADFAPRPLAPSITALGGLPAIGSAGWYDEQFLARHDPITGDVRPGTILASLVPTVPRYTPPADYNRPGGVRVAVLWIHDDPTGTEYAGASWNLAKGRNDVYLRTDGTGWWMDVENPSGRFVLKSMRRHPHFDAAVVATARFRWASTDDGIWVGCGQACCRADGEI
jgi:hypothetical protein